MTLQAAFHNFSWSSLWDIQVPSLQAGGQTSLLRWLGSGWELPLTKSQMPLWHAGLCFLFQPGWKALASIHSSALVTMLQSRPFPLRSPSTVEYPPVAFCLSKGSQDQATWHQDKGTAFLWSRKLIWACYWLKCFSAFQSVLLGRIEMLSSCQSDEIDWLSLLLWLTMWKTETKWCTGTLWKRGMRLTCV